MAKAKTKVSIQPNRKELFDIVVDIIDSHTIDPAMELIQLGEALKQIGEAIKDSSIPEAQAIIRAAAELNGIRIT